MRNLLVALLVIGVAGVASAASLDSTMPLDMKGQTPTGHGSYERQGGNTIAEAVVIPSLPHTAYGGTCDYTNNYDEVCPFSGSTAPDVVYAYTPTTNESITIDLCYSSYDTKVYVYENGHTPGAPYACNDDAHYGAPCGVYTSMIEDLPVFAGNTYYIVVDGYGSDCGPYQLDVTTFAPCVVDCPAGALLEGEPPLVDDYVDNHNGGCNTNPGDPPLQTIEAQADGCATMCAVSGWYFFQGSEYRDTDWFTVEALGGDMTYGIEAEYPMFAFVLNTDCGNIQLLHEVAVGACQPGSVTWNAPAGMMYWLWAGPQAFSGPVNEFSYVIDVCGITGGTTPTVETTWGNVKSTYR